MQFSIIFAALVGASYVAAVPAPNAPSSAPAYTCLCPSAAPTSEPAPTSKPASSSKASSSSAPAWTSSAPASSSKASSSSAPASSSKASSSSAPASSSKVSSSSAPAWTSSAPASSSKASSSSAPASSSKASSSAAPTSTSTPSAQDPCRRFGVPQCCSTDVLGVADLNCQNPSRTPKNNGDFIGLCAAVGQQAECCILPVLGQAIICNEPTPDQ